MTFVPTPEQESILNHPLNRDARILAGPGTGKSATVVALLDYAFENEASPPKAKLLTFTRAATAELAHKVSNHPSASVLRPSTIHSFAIRILVRNRGVGNLPEPLRIADPWEDKNVVKLTLRDVSGFKLQQIKKLIRAMESNWESLEPRPAQEFTRRERARFQGFWEEHRNIFGYTLLAELPFRLLEVLRSGHELEGIDSDSLIVDEYQDLNACDLALLHEMGEIGCSIIAVGDDDQSIYSFRSAAPEGIRRFPTDYPGSNDFSLSISHRCSKRILEWANHVILGDTSRPSNRNVVEPSPDAPQGSVGLLSFADQDEEAEGVAKLVKWLIENQRIPPSQILVLMRADHNAMFSNILRPALEGQGVEVCNPEWIKSIVAEPGNRGFLEYVRLLCNLDDSIAWASLMSLENGIGPGAIKAIYDIARDQNLTFAHALHDEARSNFEEIPTASRRRVAGLYARINSCVEQISVPENVPNNGWGHWLVSISGNRYLPEITDDFVALMRDLDGIVESASSLPQYISQIEPLGKDLSQSNSSGVRLMTMASSKGLTVKATICVGVEQGIIPHPISHPQEERRLLYVAMTRAKEHLYLTWARRRRGPTARVGRGTVHRRNFSPFLSSGPVNTANGNHFIRSL